jgi:putative ABC transport system permease protein
MFWQDLRYALRTLRGSPVFTAVAILSLALGIGANTAIFTLIDTLMFRQLPVREPGRLVEMLHKLRGEPDPRGNGFSLSAWHYMRDRNHVFSDLLAGADSPLQVRADNIPVEPASGQFVAGNFFPGLGLKAAAGRLLGPQDDLPGAGSAVAVIAWDWWQGKFHADPAVPGQQLVVNDVPVTIVGVAPRGFFGWETGSTHDVWLPLSLEPVIAHRPPGRSAPQVQLVGRLKPGVTPAQALSEMAVLDRRILEESAKTVDNPYLHKVMLEMEPAGAGLSRLRDKYARPLWLLMCVVALLLLIACTNVASLLLARAAARQREMAIRVALGAGGFRLVRQVLTESLLLALAGGIAGMGVAYGGTAALVRTIASGRDRIEIHVQPDARVLFFTLTVALLAGLLFGLAPALRALASTPAAFLRAAGHSPDTRFGRLFGQTLVSAQVALSLVLLSAASLFIAHLANLRRLDTGFQRENILLVTLDASHSSYARDQLSLPYRELLRRFEALPGVASATLSAVTPISGAGAARAATVEGYRAQPGEVRYLQENWVAPQYFRTFGIPLLAGRDFTPRDDGRHVAIVDQTTARYYFPHRGPLGMHVTFDGDDIPYEIIGFVRNAKYRDLLEPPWRTIYLNAFEQNRPGSQFALRTNTDPDSVIPAVRRTVRDVLKTVPIVKVTTLSRQIDASLVTERLIALLSGLFGALGALLAALGLYGLLAYTVTRRTGEIGIRRALGATQSSIVRLVLRGALAMVCAGILAGAPVVFWGRRVAVSAVEGLPPGSLPPLFLSASTLLAIALLAAWAPARRAARVDPMEALRYE